MRFPSAMGRRIASSISLMPCTISRWMPSNWSTLPRSLSRPWRDASTRRRISSDTRRISVSAAFEVLPARARPAGAPCSTTAEPPLPEGCCLPFTFRIIDSVFLSECLGRLPGILPVHAVAPPIGALLLRHALNRVLHQAMRIENQSHGPVAEDGGPGDHLNVAIKPAEVLDHRLVIAEHLVHDEAVMPVLGFNHHNLLALRPGGVRSEEERRVGKECRSRRSAYDL